jgi:hypothetical protein
MVAISLHYLTDFVALEVMILGSIKKERKELVSFRSSISDISIHTKNTLRMVPYASLKYEIEKSFLGETSKVQSAIDLTNERFSVSKICLDRS